MQNLLDTYKTLMGKRWKRMARWKKSVIIFAVVVLVVAILLVLWGLVNIKRARVVMDEGLAAKQSLEFAQVEVGNQNFEAAVRNLEEAEGHFDLAIENFSRFQVYKVIPGAARQIKAVDSVLEAGKNLTSGMRTLAQLGADVNSVLAESEGDLSIGDISADEKREILKKLSESPADLAGVKSDIELAVLLIEEIPEDGLLKQVAEAVGPIKDELPLLEAVINQAIPAAQSLPSILGYPTEKTYLFLLQNNRELRPTGGFIGTYGIVKTKDGELTTFETDNIYNLDNQAKDTVTEPSPAPIAQHTSTQNWLMRDINWSPDFPATARKARDKYHEEGGPEQQIDGVIAVTPTFIESLLELTGPLTVEGLEFNAENLFETLEYQVEFAYYENGKSESERKEIIGSLASLIMDELFAMPKSSFPELWSTFVENVDSKQILIYVDDPITQSLVIDQNWAGEMKAHDGDFLMFVDANLAALKTDNVMERNVSYKVEQRDGEYYGIAQMDYKNTGWFDGFHTRYRTYTRIYLPDGIELVENSGFLSGDKTQGGVPVEPEVYTESFTHANGETTSYTVVAGFTAIEPQAEGSLRLRYRLPEKIAKQIQNDEYRLYVQKQPGTEGHGLSVEFDIGKKVKSGRPLDILTKLGDNGLSFASDLKHDREFLVTLE